METSNRDCKVHNLKRTEELLEPSHAFEGVINGCLVGGAMWVIILAILFYLV